MVKIARNLLKRCIVNRVCLFVFEDNGNRDAYINLVLY